MILAGVDGCKGGWLALEGGLEGGPTRLIIEGSWSDLPTADWSLAAVDMPIGLAERGSRSCDRLARALLPGHRKSSVFPAPRRAMLEATSWAEAHQLGRRLEGVGLTKQSWHILPKIKAIDATIDPVAQERLREAHPELVFHHLAAWRPLAPKRSAEGRAQRLALASQAGLTGLADMLNAVPRGKAQVDDLLDAAACLLAARRIHRGEAVRLPDPPPRDARGLAMEIWY
jgi:predicted RNase H-like nuclease